MSYKWKRGIYIKAFFAYSIASIFGVVLFGAVITSIFANEAYSQTRSNKKSPSENASTKAVTAEIERDINNSDSVLIQDTEMPYFLGDFPVSGQIECTMFPAVASGQLADITHFFSLAEIKPCGFEALAISKDGQVTALAAGGGLKKVGNLAKPARVAAYHPGSARLAVFDGDKLKILENKKKPREIFPLKARPYSLQFSPDGKSLLIAAADSRLYRWNFIDYENAESSKDKDLAFERYVGHGTVVSAAAFHPAGRLVFSGDWKGSLNVWLLYDADRFQGSYDENDFWGRGFIDQTKRKKVARSDDESIEHLIISEDGEFLFLGLKNGTIEGWQVRGMKRAGQIKAHNGHIYDIALGSDGKTIVTVGRDGFAKKIAFTKEKSSNSVKYSYKELGKLEHDWIRQVEQTKKGVFAGAGLQGKIGTLDFKKE